MAYYTDSPAFQAMWMRAQSGGSNSRPLGLSGITNPRARKQPGYMPPMPKRGVGAPAQPLQRNQQNPYAFNVVSSKTSNAPGGGDNFGSMGTGQDQAQSSQAQVANAQGEAAQQTALMNRGMTQAQVAAGNAGYRAAPQPAPKPAPAPAPKPVPVRHAAARPTARPAPALAPRSLLQSREPGVGFGGIRPLMRFGR